MILILYALSFNDAGDKIIGASRFDDTTFNVSSAGMVSVFNETETGDWHLYGNVIHAGDNYEKFIGSNVNTNFQ